MVGVEEGVGVTLGEEEGVLRKGATSYNVAQLEILTLRTRRLVKVSTGTIDRLSIELAVKNNTNLTTIYFRPDCPFSSA